MTLDIQPPPNEKVLITFENDWTDPRVVRNDEGMCFVMTILDVM